MKLAALNTIILAALTVPVPVFGEIITIDATDRGWYTEQGTHFPSNTDYASGSAAGDTLRNWFMFDLSSITQTIISAELQLDNTSYASADPFEVYELHDVTTNLTDLVNGLAGVPGYDDLGTGMMYGAYTATTADIFQTIIINLNAPAMNDLNAAVGSGGMWATGGAITTLDNDPFNNEFIFNLTADLPFSSTRLVITTIPGAPGLVILFTLPLFRRSRCRFPNPT